MGHFLFTGFILLMVYLKLVSLVASGKTGSQGQAWEEQLFHTFKLLNYEAVLTIFKSIKFKIRKNL